MSKCQLYFSEYIGRGTKLFLSYFKMDCSMYMQVKLKRLNKCIIDADFTSDEILKPGDCLVYDSHNLSGGFAQLLWEKYPYSKVSECEVVQNNITPGGIVLALSPEPEIKPHIIGLQYSSSNEDLGLQKDIIKRWSFKSAIRQICCQARNNNLIQRIIIPYGIGFNDGIGWSKEEQEEWETHYFPGLAHLAYVLKNNKKELLMVRIPLGEDVTGTGREKKQVEDGSNKRKRIS